MASLFFQARGMTEYVRVFQKAPIKITKQNYLQPVQFWGRRRVKNFTLSDQDCGITGLKAEGYQARPWHNIEVEPAILVRIPPFSLVSPGCFTLVCTPTGVYKKEGGPRSSHYFAFQKILSTIYVYGVGNTTCILIRNFHKKRFRRVLHWLRIRK